MILNERIEMCEECDGEGQFECEECESEMECFFDCEICHGNGEVSMPICDFCGDIKICDI